MIGLLISESNMSSVSDPIFGSHTSDTSERVGQSVLGTSKIGLHRI